MLLFRRACEQRQPRRNLTASDDRGHDNEQVEEIVCKVQIRSGDDSEFDCYLALPAGDDRAPAIVRGSLVHGADKDMRELAERSAARLAKDEAGEADMAGIPPVSAGVVAGSAFPDHSCTRRFAMRVAASSATLRDQSRDSSRPLKS